MAFSVRWVGREPPSAALTTHSRGTCQRLFAAAMASLGALLLALPARAATCEAALPALPLVATSDAAAGKFMLAEAACGPLGVSAAASREPLIGEPRVAEQLRLYDDRADESNDAAVPRPARPATGSRAPRVAAPSGTVQRILALVPAITEAARRFGIDPLLLHAVAHVESRHQAQAQSPAGARGVLQVMPDTARRFGLGDPRRELLEPALNLQVGAEYLKKLQQRFGNDLSLVLAAYNAGEGAVEKYGRRVPPYPETQAYVRDVLATYAELRRRVGGAAPSAGSV